MKSIESDPIDCSWGPRGLFEPTSSEYIRRQSYRKTIGLTINLSESQTNIIERNMQSLRGGSYDKLSNNCSTSIANALEKVGVHVVGPWQFGTVSPYDLMNNLPKTGAVSEVNYYNEK